MLLKYGLALSAGYGSLSEASINHFMGLRTDLEQSVRGALESAGGDYYARLSRILGDARRLCLIDDRAIDSSFDHWHIPYWGEKLIERYGYHYSGMMNRAFPGIHPMTVYDLNDGCFILITTPQLDRSKDVTASESISLCEEALGFRIASMRGDRGTGSIGLTESLAQRSVPMTYYLAIKANSVLRRHARGRGWVSDEETGERACLRKGVDYHGAKTNLLVLSKQDRGNHSKRRVFLFMTNDKSSSDPFYLLRRYRMRGEHERNLGCLNALGVKHLPSTGNDKEIAGHLLTFMKLQFLFKLLKRRLRIADNCELRTIANLLLRRPGMSWTAREPDGELHHRTMIFANRGLIRRMGGSTTLRFNGRKITLMEQWRGHSRGTLLR